MAAKTSQFLVRGPDGRMVTIMATSHKAAAQQFARKYRTKQGDMISAKQRGAGAWVDYRLG